MSSLPSSLDSGSTGGDSSMQKYRKIQDRIHLENVLREANLDGDILRLILKENHISNFSSVDSETMQRIIATAQKRTIDRRRLELESEEKAITPKDKRTNNTNVSTQSAFVVSMNSERGGDFQILLNDCQSLKQSLIDMSIRLQAQSCLHDMITQIEHNDQIATVQSLVVRKKTLAEQSSTMESEFVDTSKAIQTEIDTVQSQISEQKREQENLLMKRIALNQNVTNSEKNLSELILQKKRFALMKDISQLKQSTVLRVLQFLTIDDFITALSTCRAWYHSLKKPVYFRKLRRDHVKATLWQPKEPPRKRPKQVKRAVMMLKLGGNARRQPKPDDIYQQCMQQLQIVIAQAEQDRDELRERVKAGQGVLKFMQTSMQDKMNQLSELKVRRWTVNHNLYEASQEKKTLHAKIRSLEEEMERHRRVIESMKQDASEQEMSWQRKYKIQSDLTAVRRGTTNVPMENELKKSKQQKKRMVKALMQIRTEINKRETEAKKYRQRVTLLENQYQSMSPTDKLP